MDYYLILYIKKDAFHYRQGNRDHATSSERYGARSALFSKSVLDNYVIKRSWMSFRDIDYCSLLITFSSLILKH